MTTLTASERELLERLIANYEDRAKSPCCCGPRLNKTKPNQKGQTLTFLN